MQNQEIIQMRDSIEISSDAFKIINDINKYKLLYEKEKEDKEKVIQHSKLLAQSLKDLFQKEVSVHSSFSPLSNDITFHSDQVETINKTFSSSKRIVVSLNDKHIQKEKELNETKLKLLNTKKQFEILESTLNEKHSLIESLKISNDQNLRNYQLIKQDYDHLINSKDHQYKKEALGLKSKIDDLYKLLLKIKSENDLLKQELNNRQLGIIHENEIATTNKEILQNSLNDLNQLLSKKEKEISFITDRLNKKEREIKENEIKINELLSLSSTVDGNKDDSNINLIQSFESKENEIKSLKEMIDTNQRTCFNEQTVLNDKIINLSKIITERTIENDELKNKFKQMESEKEFQMNENNTLRKVISTLNNQLRNKDIIQETNAIRNNCTFNKNIGLEHDSKLMIEKTESITLNCIEHNKKIDEQVVKDLTKLNNQLMQENEVLQNEMNLLIKQNDGFNLKIFEIEKEMNIINNKPRPLTICRITQLEQNYVSAKELIQSLKRNNEEMNQFLKQSLLENKELKTHLNDLFSNDDQYNLINIISQFKYLITDLVQKYSPHLLSINFTSTSIDNQSQNEEQYYELIRKFNKDLAKTEEKYKKYKEMMHKISKMIQNNQKEQQAQLTIQSEILNKIGNREYEFNEYKKQMKTILGNSICTNKDINNTIPFEKYEQILQIFSIEEEKYKQDIEALKQENNKIRKLIMNQSNIQLSISSSFISENNKHDSPNVSVNGKEIYCEDTRTVNRNYYNIDYIEKKFDEDEQLFKEQLELIKEELKITKQELGKYKSMKIK